jgi:hypothetical protein
MTPREWVYLTYCHSSQTEQDWASEQEETLNVHARALMTTDELDRCNDVYLGLVPTHEINAVVDKTPDGDMFVVVNLGFSYYLRLWTDLLGYWRMATQTPSGPDMALCMARLLHLATYADQYDNPQQTLTIRDELSEVVNGDPKMSEVSEGLYHTGLAFVVGHEFGHIIRGRYKYYPTDLVNHRLEYEADEFGHTIATRYTFQGATRHMIPDDPSFAFYCAFALMGPTVALGIGGLLCDVATVTHPLSEDRYLRIRKASARILGDVDKRCLQMPKKRVLSITEIVHRDIKVLGRIVNQLCPASAGNGKGAQPLR